MLWPPPIFTVSQFYFPDHSSCTRALAINITFTAQSSGEVERANPTLKTILARLGCMPKTGLNLSPFETLCGKPFLLPDMRVEPETKKLVHYLIHLGQVQLALQKCGNAVPSAPTLGGPKRFQPGQQALLNPCEEGTPSDQLSPKRKGPFTVILATTIAVKPNGIEAVCIIPG